MKNHIKTFPVDKMAMILNVSRAGYYKYINRKESATSIKNKELLIKIKNISIDNREVYGSPRIHATLRKKGEMCSRKRVAKIMRNNGIQSKIRIKWKAHSNKAIDFSKVAPNLLNQNFTVDTANKIWVHDITYIFTNEGWLYLSAVLDLYSRKIVGLSMNSSMDAKLVIKSLNQAMIHRNPNSELILHSDRGSQYTSYEYQKVVEENKFKLSMSSKGNCYDNAAMESFFHTLKTEHVFFCKYKTRNEAIVSIFEYIEVFYNRKRVHSTIGYMSPVEYEMTAVG